MRLVIPALLLFACKNGETDEPTDTADPPTVDTDPPTPLGGDEGGVALLRTYEAGVLTASRLVGLFVSDDQDFVNVAQCALDEEAPCLRALPPVGQQRPFQPIDRFVPSDGFTQYVGLRVRVGPWVSNYTVGDELSYYDADLTDEEAFSGPARVRFDGVEWGPFDVEDAITVPDGFTLISPLPLESTIVFSDDDAFPLLWVADPTTDADIVITVRHAEDPEVEAKVLRVPDTGSYGLDLSNLGFTGDQPLILNIGRWTLDDFDVNGNAMTVQTVSESVLNLDFRDVGLREPIEIVEECRIEPPRLPLGRFYGDLTLAFNDYEEVACLQSFDAANGTDAVFTLSVPPRTRTEVTYRQLDANASMYLLDGCAPGSPCVMGADSNSGQGPETLTVFNDSATEFLTYTLVLDAADEATGGLFFLDHERTALPEPDWADTCVQALAAAELVPGDYYGPDLQAFTNRFDLSFSDCTGTSLPGPDGLLPITIPTGQRLEVSMSMTDGDAALYLLSDCSDVDTCLLGEDMPGDVEVLVYENTSGADLPVFLVLDTDGPSGPYFMTVTLN